jgi:hypothetical protein
MGEFWQSFKRSFADINQKWYSWGYEHGFAWGTRVADARVRVNTIMGFDFIPQWLSVFVAVAPFVILGVGIITLECYAIYKLGTGLFGYFFPASDAVAELPWK